MASVFSRPWASKRPKDLVREIDILLWDLGTVGFCNRLSGADLVREHPVITADLFADIVLRAEGFDPPLEPGFVRTIRDRFCKRFRTTEVAEASWVPEQR